MSVAVKPITPVVPASRVTVRWQDLDPLGHVGHTVFLAYLEEARNALLDAHGIALDGYVVAAATLNYRNEIRMGTAFVRGCCRVTRVGRTSVTMEEQLRAPDGRLLADATVVVVLWDPVERRPRAVSAAERATLQTASTASVERPTSELKEIA